MQNQYYFWVDLKSSSPSRFLTLVELFLNYFWVTYEMCRWLLVNTFTSLKILPRCRHDDKARHVLECPLLNNPFKSIWRETTSPPKPHLPLHNSLIYSTSQSTSCPTFLSCADFSLPNRSTQPSCLPPKPRPRESLMITLLVCFLDPYQIPEAKLCSSRLQQILLPILQSHQVSPQWARR